MNSGKIVGTFFFNLPGYKLVIVLKKRRSTSFLLQPLWKFKGATYIWQSPALLYKVPSKSTDKNFVTNVYILQTNFCLNNVKV